MSTSKISPFASVLTFLSIASLAHAATFTGIVTNKTDGKPSAGDTVVLVDVQAGMAEAATATTDSRGHYLLEAPGVGPYLIRVNHQGGTYFIAAPQNGDSGDINVYDIAAKVDGIGIDADMLLVEAAGGMLRVQERYLVRNTSLPPKAQFSSNTFEIVLPADAELDGASATRPGGLPTNTRLIPLGQKRHYSFNVPIQPDQGEKETLFEIQYHISYGGKYTFTPHLQLPADNLVVYAAKGMQFTAGQGTNFQSAQEDPRVQTFVSKNIHPGQSIGFTIAGEGQMPRETQGAAMGQQASMGDARLGDGGNPGSRPGGGLGAPIDSPDPLTKYKWWILASLILLLVAAAAFLLRKRGEVARGSLLPVQDATFETDTLPIFASRVASPTNSSPLPKDNSTTLLGILKDEMFAIERERLSGALSPGEYAEVKRGLDAVLKRALKDR
ncbi:MAG: carboxypeptidase-like regulatory domain-containing protein [Terracidiphilus sp.]